MCYGRSPRKMGRKGSASGVDGNFAKTCFESAVGAWSAWSGKEDRFLLVFLAFSVTDLIAHNPEGNEATAAGGGRREGAVSAAVYIFKAASTAAENIGHRKRVDTQNRF